MASNPSPRAFVDSPAVRQRVPLLTGLMGPSGSGKTYSMLELLTGFQRVTGGDIGVIDTEARRALHYADTFKFRHLPFEAPFGPLDYLAAVEHFHKKGVRNIGIDSQSHEHEGPGGVLEMHEQEVERMVKAWNNATPDKVKFAAWQKPKSERRRYINTLLQMPINFVFCFRAKEKLKVIPGQQPKSLGWMPIAGEEFLYEMTLNCLLYPNSGGVPTWRPSEPGEKEMVKLPAQFRDIFRTSRPLNADTGESLARWAEGGAAPQLSATQEAAALRDEIVALLRAHHGGEGKAAQDARAALVAAHFGVTKMKAFNELPPDKLREGLDDLQRHLEGPPLTSLFDDEADREAAEEREAIQAAG